MKSLKNLDYPKIGKFILLAMSMTQSCCYLYLSIQYNSGAGLALSLCLFFTALLTLTLTLLSIIPKIYYQHTWIYVSTAILALISRFGCMVAIFLLNDRPSQQFYITEDGYSSLMQTTLIFSALNCLLLYEKTHYYRTKKSDELRMMLLP